MEKQRKHEEGAHKLVEVPTCSDDKTYIKHCNGCYTKLRETFTSKEL